MDEVGQVLLDAADVLSERGLYKGELVNPYTGREVCMSGAIMAALGTPLTSEGRYRFGSFPEGRLVAWTQAIHRVEKTINCYVPEYNDHDTTTLEDAVLALKRAAGR